MPFAVPLRILPLNCGDWQGQQGNRSTPSPWVLVSVASKGLRFYVSGLESTLTGISISVDSKEVALGKGTTRGPRISTEHGTAGIARSPTKSIVQGNRAGLPND